MAYTRPDLAQVVSVVSRYICNLGKEHWQDVKHIFRCLKSTIDIGIVYHEVTFCALADYSNSEYPAYLGARRSKI